MRVLIPQNSLLWTTDGICLGRDMNQGVEIFTMDMDGKLASIPVHEPDIPEELLVHTLITRSGTCTSIPHYAVGRSSAKVGEFAEHDIPEMVSEANVKRFRKYHDERSVEFLERSPVSVTAASYIGKSGIETNKQALRFDAQDESTSREIARSVRDDLTKEFNGTASITRGVRRQYGNKYRDASFIVLYRSDRLYRMRSSFDLKRDRMNSMIYTNGLNIYFGFLRSLLGGGMAYHIPAFTRGGKHTILNIPWKNKVRKLLQNSCHIWRRYQLLAYREKSQCNIDEVRLAAYSPDLQNDEILEVKQHMQDCYEIDIPTGHTLILDNMLVRPLELTGKEWDEIRVPAEPESGFVGLRNRINGAVTNDADIVKPIASITTAGTSYGICVVGRVKNADEVTRAVTRYGATSCTYAILEDDTGEVKVRLWGEVATQVKLGDILEIRNGYAKRGILHNSMKGSTHIHDVELQP